MNDVPKLSALLAVRDEFETIRKTVDHLRRQTIADEIELVVVGPAHVFENVTPTQFPEFMSCRFVTVEAIDAPSDAYAYAVERASAPVVAFCEDHSFPDPAWAASLIKAHREPWAAVGPAMRNGNPTSVVSWAAFFMSFGPWAAPAQASTVTHLPWFNNSYKRDVLLAYGAKLRNMLDAESVLHWDLIAQGHQLYLEPGAQTDHLNVAQLFPWMRFQFHAGRTFGAKRCKKWPLWRRWFYFAASPLIPPLRLYQTQKEVRRPGRCPDRLGSVLCVLTLGLIADGIGQALGYVAGAGDSVRKSGEYELNRTRYL